MDALPIIPLRSFTRHFLGICLLFLILASLSFAPLARAEILMITDDLNREIRLNQVPSRIISLAPSVTEILFALGLDQEIAGVTAACDFPSLAKIKPSIGTSMNPDLEKIVSLQPDIVIAAKGIFRPELIKEMERLHVPIYVSDPATLGALFKNIEHLGKLTGKMEKAHSLILEMRSRITSIQKSLRGIPPHRVLYILWHDPLMTVGPGSFIHELIETAGGQNIYSKTGIPYTQFSMEAVIAKDPEVIIFPDELGKSAIQSQKGIWQKRWGMLSAVKAGRLYTANSDLLHRPGPRIVEGLEFLAHAIHPEVFGDEIQTTHP